MVATLLRALDGGVERLLKDRGKGPRSGKKPISAEVRLGSVTRTAKEAMQRNALERNRPRRSASGQRAVQRVWKEHGLKRTSFAPIQAIERSQIR